MNNIAYVKETKTNGLQDCHPVIVRLMEVTYWKRLMEFFVSNDDLDQVYILNWHVL